MIWPLGRYRERDYSGRIGKEVRIAATGVSRTVRVGAVKGVGPLPLLHSSLAIGAPPGGAGWPAAFFQEIRLRISLSCLFSLI